MDTFPFYKGIKGRHQITRCLPGTSQGDSEYMHFSVYERYTRGFCSGKIKDLCPAEGTLGRPYIGGSSTEPADCLTVGPGAGGLERTCFQGFDEQKILKIKQSEKLFCNCNPNEMVYHEIKIFDQNAKMIKYSKLIQMNES